MFNEQLLDLVREISNIAKKNNIHISTAESCTAGMISSVLTSIEGSSDFFDRGFVVYSNKSKSDILNVPTYFIEDYGPVSLQVAIALAEGANLVAGTNASISIVGNASMSRAVKEEEVGLIFMATEVKGKIRYKELHLKGGRNQIRLESMQIALEFFLESIKSD